MRSGLVTSAAVCTALASLSAATAGPSDEAGDGAVRPAAAAPSPDAPEPAADPVVRTETQLRTAWADPRRTRIDLGGDISLRDCWTGDPIRESPYPMTLDGHGFTIRQTCFEKRLLRQDGTGHVRLDRVRLTRGGADGPGAAVTTRGEIVVTDSVIEGNLSEEPGGGVFSMRRATVRGSRISGNLANDDGGGVYARRGGVQVYDSVLSNNLVDGSGGAIGSTGDILVVRSYVDGNTTDGDGGALYTDEDGDVTVVDSFIDGSDADGPGGAIFTLDGDVAILGSTLLGNRADDRGGAIAGEADVLIVNSTLARNLAVAHVGGAVSARGDLMLVNSTVTDNYAEGEGGGLIASGRTTLIGSTVTGNTASVGANIGSGNELVSYLSILGPALSQNITGDTRPTRRSCRVYAGRSLGWNFHSDDTCKLTDASDIGGGDPRLAMLEDDANGFVLVPFDGSPVRARVPRDQCVATLPAQVPAGQLLAPYLDWQQILAEDAVGTSRVAAERCDIGAVQSPPPAARPPTRPGPATLPAWPDLPDAVDTRDDDRVEPADLRRAPSLRPVRAPARRSLASYAAALDRLGRRIARLDGRARRWNVLLSCIRPVPVDRAGDPRHRWGFLYDERDGTGLDVRPALVPHVGRTAADIRLLRLSRQTRCLSTPVDPNGTGADARPVTRARPARRPTVRGLLRRLERLERRADRVDGRTELFDDWSSCVTWLPVTEAGDADQDLGYLQRADGPTTRHLPALDVDESEWDDPDYMLLAFLAGDDPRGPRECETEPGEAVDRPVARRVTGAQPAPRTPRRARRADPGERDDLRQGIADLREDVEDLGEPVAEITQFDECMYTVGARVLPGYDYRSPRGRTSRPALSFAMSADQRPAYDLLAFPGEEPPQIECNEDAGGNDTEE